MVGQIRRCRSISNLKQQSEASISHRRSRREQTKQSQEEERLKRKQQRENNKKKQQQQQQEKKESQQQHQRDRSQSRAPIVLALRPARRSNRNRKSRGGSTSTSGACSRNDAATRRGGGVGRGSRNRSQSGGGGGGVSPNQLNHPAEAQPQAERELLLSLSFQSSTGTEDNNFGDDQSIEILTPESRELQDREYEAQERCFQHEEQQALSQISHQHEQQVLGQEKATNAAETSLSESIFPVNMECPPSPIHRVQTPPTTRTPPRGQTAERLSPDPRDWRILFIEDDDEEVSDIDATTIDMSDILMLSLSDPFQPRRTTSIGSRHPIITPRAHSPFSSDDISMISDLPDRRRRRTRSRDRSNNSNQNTTRSNNSKRTAGRIRRSRSIPNLTQQSEAIVSHRRSRREQVKQSQEEERLKRKQQRENNKKKQQQEKKESQQQQKRDRSQSRTPIVLALRPARRSNRNRKSRGGSASTNGGRGSRNRSRSGGGGVSPNQLNHQAEAPPPPGRELLLSLSFQSSTGTEDNNFGDDHSIEILTPESNELQGREYEGQQRCVLHEEQQASSQTSQQHEQQVLGQETATNAAETSLSELIFLANMACPPSPIHRVQTPPTARTLPRGQTGERLSPDPRDWRRRYIEDDDQEVSDIDATTIDMSDILMLSLSDPFRPRRSTSRGSDCRNSPPTRNALAGDPITVRLKKGGEDCDDEEELGQRANSPFPSSRGEEEDDDDDDNKEGEPRGAEDFQHTAFGQSRQKVKDEIDRNVVLVGSTLSETARCRSVTQRAQSHMTPSGTKKRERTECAKMETLNSYTNTHTNAKTSNALARFKPTELDTGTKTANTTATTAFTTPSPRSSPRDKSRSSPSRGSRRRHSRYRSRSRSRRQRSSSAVDYEEELDSMDGGGTSDSRQCHTSDGKSLRHEFRRVLDETVETVIESFRCNPNNGAKQVLANPNNVMSLFYGHLCISTRNNDHDYAEYFEDDLAIDANGRGVQRLQPNVPRRQRPYYDELFTQQWLQQMTTTGISLLYLQAPHTPGNESSDEWKGRAVQLIIVRGGIPDGGESTTTGGGPHGLIGNTMNGWSDSIQPKLQWSTMAGGKSNRILTTSIPLLKIHSILTSNDSTADAIFRGVPMDDFDDDSTNLSNRNDCFLTITSKRGDVHVFETNCVEDRDIVLSGLRNVITCLSFHLITGDARSSVELYDEDTLDGDGGEVPANTPRLPNPRLHMNRIAHALLD